MLKTDLHIHTSEDKKDYVSYSAKEIIEYASGLGFDVLAITHHDSVFFNEDLKRFAKKRGILLIPGIEKDIEGAHILILNPPRNLKIKKFEDLGKIRNKNCLIIPSHPFYPIQSIGNRLIKYKHLFDAIEYCHFYLRFFNLFNKKAKKASKRLKIPLIGNSDAHHLWQINSTFSYIDAKKEINSIFEAIRKNKIRLHTRPITILRFLEIIFSEFIKYNYRKVYKKL